MNFVPGEGRRDFFHRGVRSLSCSCPLVLSLEILEILVAEIVRVVAVNYYIRRRWGAAASATEPPRGHGTTAQVPHRERRPTLGEERASTRAASFVV